MRHILSFRRYLSCFKDLAIYRFSDKSENISEMSLFDTKWELLLISDENGLKHQRAYELPNVADFLVKTSFFFTRYDPFYTQKHPFRVIFSFFLTVTFWTKVSILSIGYKQGYKQPNVAQLVAQKSFRQDLTHFTLIRV